jgi:hypothetical protein
MWFLPGSALEGSLDELAPDGKNEHGPRGPVLTKRYDRMPVYSMTMSTRRFFSRLARVSLGAIGRVRPNP